jgi:hypothetical protein
MKYPCSFMPFSSGKINLWSVLGLHRVAVGDVSDVSEVIVASIFRVWRMQVSKCVCVFIAFYFPETKYIYTQKLANISISTLKIRNHVPPKRRQHCPKPRCVRTQKHQFNHRGRVTSVITTLRVTSITKLCCSGILQCHHGDTTYH